MSLKTGEPFTDQRPPNSTSGGTRKAPPDVAPLIGWRC